MTPEAITADDSLLQKLQKEDAVVFEKGLPGFPNEKKFVLLQNPKERPFIWMQSSTNPELCFIVTSPFIFFPEYLPDVSDDDLAEIGSPTMNELMLVTIVWFKTTSALPEVHTNLKAPIVINLKNFKARQTILNNESMYSERAIYRMKKED